MCGINGFFSKSLNTYNNIITEMNKAISHRGPDTNGKWEDKNSGIVLGHQRLSIIDITSAGNQPMQSFSKRYILTFNGEIYNHLEIRNELEINNSKKIWRGNSDTETLIEAIDFWGIEITLKKIEGMFAFGLWDKKKHSLILARDRIGEKPLYYGWQGEGINKVFLFGSELKALKVHPEFKGEINRDTIALQLRYNCIPAPYSIYKNIYKLQPGYYLELKEDDLKKGLIPNTINYWSLKNCAIYGNINQIKLSDVDFQKDLERQLKLSVKKQMMSDVPLGAFLSGGIDSSLIVALMQSESIKSINTFTIGFSENEYNEALYAKKIANHLGTNHTELYVSSKNALEVIPQLPTIYDEPFSDSSQIPTIILSKLAKKHVKVALSGDAGDELFCGYNRYLISKNFSNTLNLIPLNLRKILASAIKVIPSQNWLKLSKFLPKYNQYNNFGDKLHKGADVLGARTQFDLYYMLRSHWHDPSEITKNCNEPKTILNKLNAEVKNLNSQEQMMILDMLTYLPDDILVKLDRAAMSSSIETRVPFLDHKLIEYSWQIPHSLKFRNRQGKWILRKILNQYVPKKYFDRPKMGFGVPIDSWLRGPLKDWAENLLNEKKLRQEGYFNEKLIKDKWIEHQSGKKNWQYQLWDILMFQSWLEINK